MAYIYRELYLTNYYNAHLKTDQMQDFYDCFKSKFLLPVSANECSASQLPPTSWHGRPCWEPWRWPAAPCGWPGAPALQRGHGTAPVPLPDPRLQETCLLWLVKKVEKVFFLLVFLCVCVRVVLILCLLFSFQCVFDGER